jgi:hypothetical protein
MTEPVQQAILALPEHAWTPAVQVDGQPRDGGDVAELTALLPAHGVDLMAKGWPAGIRVIVRRERPHPGAQLTFSDIHGYRFQTFATNTKVGQLAAWKPVIARTPGSRTASAPARTPGSAGSLTPLRDQRRLAAAGPDRDRPARLDPDHAPRPGQRPGRG